MRVSPDPSTYVEAWLRQRRWLVLAIVVAVSVAFRVAAFSQLGSGPFLSLERWTETDMHYYDAWGRAIAHGDWWSASIGVPMHGWHTDVARQCVATRPAGTSAEEIWREWNGPHVFYEDALYPYLIALTYRAIGESTRYVIAWQLLLGVLSNVLLLAITRRYFGKTAGAVAGILAALCAPLLQYELLLLRDSTVVMTTLALIWLAGSLEGSRPIVRAALFGLACGVAALLKSTLLLLSVILLAGTFVAGDRGRSRLRRLAAWAAGLALPILLLVARNAVVGAPLLAFSGSGAITFVVANNVDYPVRGGFSLAIDQIGQIMCATGGRLASAVATTLSAHSPWSYAVVLWHKFDEAWFWYEIPNNANFYYLRLHAAALDAMPVTFFWLAPLGLVGLALAWRDRKRVWPIYAVAVWAVSMLTMFLVLGRLRAVLVAAMIPFAALTLVRLVRSSRPWRILLAIVLLGAWTGRPLPADVPLISVTDWFTPYWTTYEGRVRALMAHDDMLGAARAMQESFQYEPEFSEMDRANGQLVNSSDRAAARAFAEMHGTCAALFARANDPSSADAERLRAASLTRLGGAGPDR